MVKVFVIIYGTERDGSLLHQNPNYFFKNLSVNYKDILPLVLNFDRGEIGKMELPNESLKNQFTCIEISSSHVNPNLFLLRKTLHSSDIDAAISHLRFYLSGRSNKNYGIELEDGSIIDSEGLQDLKHLRQLIECQIEIREENLWLENLPELLKFPNRLLNDTLPVFATQFVSLLQSNGINKEI